MARKKNLNEFMDYLLKEDNNIPQPQSSFETRPVDQPKDISLDQVVDRYLVRYEKEAIPTTDAYQGEMFESVKPFGQLLTEVLNEADDDEPVDDTSGDDAAAGGDDMGGLGDDLSSTTDIGGGASKKTDSENAQAIINTPQINLQEFANKVARLVNNFETLLNPKDIILNRVENYILTNYDQRTAEELMTMLDTNYSLRTAEKRDENENEVSNTYIAGALSSEG